MECSDQQLVSRIASGDRGAFAEFYDRHAPAVLGLLVRLLGQRADADDVLQDAFLQVWRRAPQYDAGRSTPLGWLILIARSRALDYLRRRRPPNAPAPETADVALADPADGLQWRETAGCVRAALKQLPKEQRSAIGLAFFAGLSHEQVARRLGVPLGTAKTRIRLGIQRLRALLDEVSVP
jgi:RNA polymerase sigma-70 factor (ECF subfamily)